MEATMNRIKVTHHSNPALEDRREPGFFEAMLRDDVSVDRLVRDEEGLLSTIQKLLGLGVAGLFIYGLAMGIVMELAKAQIHIPGTPIVWVPLTLVGGFMGAIAICLPSFYFYTQLSGLDASFRLVTAQSLRVQARASVFLLGVLPFYIAWALAAFVGIDGLVPSLEAVILVGFAVPFLVGTAGLLSIYRSFRRLLHHLPITHKRRCDFVLRMVLCWGAVVLAIVPVAIYRLAEFLSQVI